MRNSINGLKIENTDSGREVTITLRINYGETLRLKNLAGQVSVDNFGNATVSGFVVHPK